MTDMTASRRPATRILPIVLAMTSAVAVSGCSKVFGDDSGYAYREAYYQPRVGDTPDYATSSIPQGAGYQSAYPVETGIAAWNGDISQAGLTAAHQSLPPRSWARVTNVATGRSTTVRITERLPSGAGRAIELSRDAAAAVGALHNGLVTVLIEPLDPRQTTPQDRQWVQAQPVAEQRLAQPVAPRRAPAPTTGIAYDPNLATGSIPTQPAAAPPRTQSGSGLASRVIGTSYLQLGSFKDGKNAHRLLSQLGQQGMTAGEYGDGFIETAYVNGEIWHRVRLGPIETNGEARRALKDAQSLGHNGARLVRP
ncbi:MAG: SPOR domain-containing protein [Pseudomonadota bacterium]